MTASDSPPVGPPARPATRVVVARVDELPPGTRRIVTAGDRQVGVFNVDGRFYALLNRCPHLAGPLCEGQVVNAVESAGPGDVRLEDSRTYVTCPWHNWEFDIETGRSSWNPRLRARPLPVEVTSGTDLDGAIERGEVGRVPGPYRAETVPVSIESDYVVLSLRPPRGPA